MSHKLTDARRSLERAQQAAKNRLAEIDDEKREVKRTLRSLAAAIKALDGRGSPRTLDKMPSSETAFEDAHQGHGTGHPPP